MKYFKLILVLFISIESKAQLPSGIDALPVLVEFKTNQGESFGSGFFYQDSTNFYFVTANHVLTKQIVDSIGRIVDYAFIDSIVTLKYYPRNPVNEEHKTLILNLNGLWRTGNIVISADRDVVAVRIATVRDAKNNNAIINYFTQYVFKPDKSSFVSTISPNMIDLYNKVQSGSDIYLFGYPKALGLKEQPQYDFYRPLVRKGIVAGKNNKLHTIIIDCPVYPGNSGGPVLQINNDEFKLIGIAIQFIPELIEWKNTNYGISNHDLVNSGYTVVASIDILFDMIKQYK